MAGKGKSASLAGTKPPAIMNAYLTKLMIYHEIHRMNREGYSISKISRTTSFNRRTVRSYLAMSEVQFDQFMEHQTERRKDLFAYEDFIKLKLEKHRDTSAAQMHDWLKEQFADFPPISAKTVFNYVGWVRIKYHLPKVSPTRQYEKVEELPYGHQAQVDFGEYNMRTSNGKRVKVFFFTMVLSRSRYKYIWFTDKYFTTELACQAHEQAFVFINGIPYEIVYDLDKVFITNENHGDVILTEGFKAYTREKSFKLHFCRKSDPESKGKVENVVKYVKQNFLFNRPYEDIESLNTAALAWLGRTANALPHNGTKKSPVLEWEIEKPLLTPYFPSPVKAEQVFHTVIKDNTICWKSNYYSLPLGTYKGTGSKVVVNMEGDNLSIYDLEGVEICKHVLAVGKGQTIKKTDHSRDKKPAIDQMIDQLCLLLDNPLQGRQFLNAIRESKPRYIRDQLLIMSNTIEKHEHEVIEQALDYCCKNKLASAIDFKKVVEKFTRPVNELFEPARVLKMNPLNGTLPSVALVQPARSSIEDYQSIIQSKLI